MTAAPTVKVAAMGAVVEGALDRMAAVQLVAAVEWVAAVSGVAAVGWEAAMMSHAKSRESPTSEAARSPQGSGSCVEQGGEVCATDEKSQQPRC